MEAEKVRKKPKVKKPGNTQKMNLILEEGAAITFSPGGKKLRIVSIENGEITFEQTP